MCLSPWAKGFGRGYETAFSSAIASRKAPENSAGYQFFSGLCDHRSLLNSLMGALYSPPTPARAASLPHVLALLFIAEPISLIAFECAFSQPMAGQQVV